MARRPPRKAAASLTPPDLLAGEDLPPEPRQARSVRARDALLASALANFERNGYEATTIEQVASDAGVAVGGFYLHFRSKRQVLLVLMDRFLRELGALGGAALPDGVRARDAIAALVRNALRVDNAYLGAYRAWHELILHDRELARQHAEIDRWSTARVTAMLQGLTRTPGGRSDLDVEPAALVLNTLFWRLLESKVAGDEAVIRSTIDIVTRTILRDDAP